MIGTRRWLYGGLATAIIAACSIGQANANRDLVVVHGDAARPARPVSVSLIPTSSSTVDIGAPLGFRVMSSADGYGHLYVLSASGKVQLWLENRRVRANRMVAYPAGSLAIRAAAPAGDETVVFLVTRERFYGFAGRKTTLTPMVLQHTHAGFSSMLEQKTASMPRRYWASASVVIRVRDH